MKQMVVFLSLMFCKSFLFAQEPKLMLPIGHTASVNSAHFSPDGKRIVTASDDQTAKIWDTKTGHLLTNLVGHKSYVKSANFSSDGKKIVTTCFNSVKIWDALSGILLLNLIDSSRGVFFAEFTPDGKRVVTAIDSVAKIWDAATGILLFELKRHTYFIRLFEFSSDGKKIFTIDDHGEAKIWNLTTGEFLIDIERLSPYSNSAHFSPDGKKLVATCYDSTAKIWNVKTGEVLVNLTGNSSYLTSAKFSNDGKKIVISSGDSTAKVWDVETGIKLLDLKGHTSIVRSAQFSHDGKKIVTDSYDNTAKIWDVVTGAILLDFKGHTSYLNSVEFSKDGKKIVTTSYDKTTKIWDAATGTILIDLKGHTSSLNSVNFSPDGQKVVIASDGNTANIWDMESGVSLFDLKGDRLGVNFAKFSPDGRKIVTTSIDKTVKIWDANTGTFLLNLAVSNFGKISAQFSPDGKKILISAFPEQTKIFDVETGALLLELKNSSYGLNFPQFSPNGKTFVTNSMGIIGIFDVETGALLVKLKDYSFFNNLNLFSPDGKKIVTLTENGIEIWDVTTGKFLMSLKGDNFGINSAHFSPDGEKLVTIHFSGIKIWDVATGKLLFEPTRLFFGLKFAGFSPNGKKIFLIDDYSFTVTIFDALTGALLVDLKGHSLEITSAQFSPDGKKIITTSMDNTAKVWSGTTGKELYTFFAVDSTDYLLIDKDGHFDGTDNALKLLYYTCGTEIIDLEQFKTLSWEPGLVSKIMGINKEPITAKKLSEINICNTIPVVEEKGFKEGIYNFEIIPQNAGVGEVQLYVNDKLVKIYHPTDLPKKKGVYQLAIKQQELLKFFVTGNGNQVTVKATTKEGTMSSRGVSLRSTIDKKSTANPNIFIVSIGVSKYKGEALRLGYASKDALDFSNAITSSAKKYLNTDGKNHVTTYSLNTETNNTLWPAKSKIKEVFNEIADTAKADDILVVFFAGHGALKPGEKNYYLLTAEATSFEQVMNFPKEVAIGTDELNEWMRKIKANKQVLILDACNSGQGAKNMQELIVKRDVPADQQRALEKLKDITGTYILSASTANQPAYETSLYGQGLLTYSLLSGIKLGGGLRENKFIDITKWFNNTKENVKILAKEINGRQDPEIYGNASFDIGLVDKEIVDAIKLSIKKKVFNRSKFIGDEDALSDELNLSGLVDRELNNLSARGKESPLAYAGENMLEDSYSIRGKYLVNGNTVTVKVTLYIGQKEKVYQFDINGTVDKKDDLGIKIVENVQVYLNKQ